MRLDLQYYLVATAVAAPGLRSPDHCGERHAGLGSNRWVFGPLLGYVMCDNFGEASFLRCNVWPQRADGSRDAWPLHPSGMQSWRTLP